MESRLYIENFPIEATEEDVTGRFAGSNRSR